MITKYLSFSLLAVIIALMVIFSVPSNIFLTLGFMVILAYLLGEIFDKFKLPKVSGYLLVGIILGPFALNFINIESAFSLQFIDMITLTIIAFVVGKELSIKELKKDLKTIIIYTFIVISVTFFFETLFSYLIYHFYPFMGKLPHREMVIVALIFGFLALAKSPLTTVALMKETNAYTRTPRLILSITVLKDIIVLIGFALFMSILKAQEFGTTGSHLIFGTLWEVFGSFLIGFIIGMLSLLYLKYIKRQNLLMLLILAIFISILSEKLHINNLLVAISVGFIIENFSALGDEFLTNVEIISTFIYILFFSIRGANLDLDAVRKTYFISIMLIVLRTIITYFALRFASKLQKDTPWIYKYGWSGFINQSGVTLAIALIIKNSFPRYADLVAISISLIVITDIFAPPIFKLHLLKIKEREEKTENKVIS